MRTLALVILASVSFQALPQANFSGFNYQAVIRDANGDPLPNQLVRLKFDIGALDLYSESHLVTTDDRGLVLLVIGDGIPEVGTIIPTLGGIDWAGGVDINYTVSVDITGGTSYVFLSSGPFRSVPFSMHALSSGTSGDTHWQANGTDISNTNSGKVGIGTSTPTTSLHLRTSGQESRIRLETLGSVPAPGGQQSGYAAQIDLRNFKGKWSQGMHPNGNWILQDSADASPTLTVTQSGRLGIGRTPTSYNLEVEGSMRLRNAIRALDNTGLEFKTDDGVTHMHLADNGRIGLGTSTPEASLHIVGQPNMVPGILFQGGSEDICTLTNTAIQFGHWDGTTFTEDMAINSVGDLVVGTAAPTGRNLKVNGKIWAREVEVTLASFPDYVFEPDYDLMTLEEVERFIQAHGHLPNVPSACEVEEKGLGLGEMNKILLEKVEELTLYLIAKEAELRALRDDIDALMGR